MKQKIALSLVVMSLILSVLAIPASAVTKTKSTPYGTLTASLTSTTYYDSSTLKGKRINYSSLCSQTAPRIIASAEVLRWSDGKYLYEEKADRTNTNYAGYDIYTDHFREKYGDDFYTTKISVYGAHEIRGSSSYGIYTQLVGV